MEALSLKMCAKFHQFEKQSFRKSKHAFRVPDVDEVVPFVNVIN